MTKLPEYDVLETTPAPPGWFAYYVRESQKVVIALPIALWALVEYEDDGGATRELRPFIVSKLGTVMDYLEPEECNLLCVLAPGVDHMACVRTLIPQDSDVNVSTVMTN